MAKIDQNHYVELKMEKAWQQEITFDWENLDHAASFKHCKKKFCKTYASLAEVGLAFITFLYNWKMINDFNSGDERSFTFRMNHFSDLNGDDFLVYVHCHDGSCLKKRCVKERVEMRPLQG
eukprot:796142_1